MTEICELYSKSDISQSKIAKLYGVSQSLVCMIVSGKRRGNVG